MIIDSGMEGGMQDAMDLLEQVAVLTRLSRERDHERPVDSSPIAILGMRGGAVR